MEGRQIIIRGITVVGALIVLGYSYFVVDDFVRGPRLVISSPQNGVATMVPLVTISGKALHVNTLALDGDPIQFDLDGNFRESLLLAEGYNIMKLSATDRYGRVIEKSIKMTLLPSPVATSTATTTTNNL